MQHIVHKQKVTIQVSKSDEANNVHRRLNNVLQERLKQEMQTIFDRASLPGNILRIDLLSIDIGTINSENFEQEFQDRFASRLEAALLKATKEEHENDGKSVSISTSKSLLDSFFFFLVHGYLPWYSKITKTVELEDAVLSQFSESNWNHCKEFLEEAKTENPVIIHRLAEQFSNAFLEILFVTVAPQFKDKWEEIYSDLLSFAHSLQVKKESNVRSIIWRSCLANFSNENGNSLYWIVRSIYTQIINPSVDSMQLQLTQFINVVAKTVAVKEAINQLIGEVKSRVVSESASKTENETKNKISTANSSAENAGSEELDQQSVHNISVRNTIENAKAGNTNSRMNGVNGDNDSRYKTEERNKIEIRPNRPSKAKTVETLYVNNSGIILLHPFLQPYFTGLELMKDKQFLTEELRARGVLLLHYLATGDTEVAEFNLAFQKILCGFAIEETLPAQIDVTEKEKEESAKLLQSVTDYWPPLKNTSAEGFQTSFLQRDGKLSLKDSGWLLVVEQKTIDILLGKLPWGFSTIRLPWMKGMVSVEWC